MKAYKNNTAKSPSLLSKVFGLGQGQEQGQEHVHRQGRGHRNGAAVTAVVFVLALLLSVSTAVSTVFAQQQDYATFDAPSDGQPITGTLKGVGFTITPLNEVYRANRDYSEFIPDLGSTSRQFIGYATTTQSFTVTFDEAIESLAFYAISFRNQNTTGYSAYEFTGAASTAEYGFTNDTQGPRYDVSDPLTYGVIRFSEPVTQLTVSGIGTPPTENALQDFTFSVPPPSGPTFRLAGNGITVTCDWAAIGETGVVNINGTDVTFTKRAYNDITPENAATTCTSGITSMFRKFANNATFNEDISHWDVSDVRNMLQMFDGATSFNQDIGAWNTSSLVSTSQMFRGATSFNQDIGEWDMWQVYRIDGMFQNASAFNQDIGGWDVSSVGTDASTSTMDNMFHGAAAFNQNIGGWDVSKVTSMDNMFHGAAAFNQNIGNWDVSSVTSMENMFKDAIAFNQDIGNWDLSGIEEEEAPFAGDPICDDIPDDPECQDIPSFSGLFEGAISFNQDISGWDVSSVENMDRLFKGAVAFDQDISAWDVSNVTTMDEMFSGSLSTANYDSLLIGWSALTLQNGVTLDVGDTEYTYSQAERQSIIDTYGWTINDGGFLAPPFITTWEVTESDLSLQIPTRGDYTNYADDDPEDIVVTDYDFTIDWGDGTVETVSGDDPDPSHTYATAGTYTVKISGTFPWMNLGEKPNFTYIHSETAKKLQTVEQWGDIQWESLEGMFTGAENMTYNATDVPNLSSVTSLFETFRDARSFNGDISGWDVSNITSMEGTFKQATSFNQDIGGWDVRNVTTFFEMFYNDPYADLPEMSFNADISGWNTTNVTNMSEMFRNHTTFNQDIGRWDVSNVTTMRHMFREATQFNGNINDWNLAKVTSLSGMFWGATAFNQPLDKWVFPQNDTLANFFRDATSFNQDISGWDVSNITSISSTFRGATSFNQNISGWDVSNVDAMSSTFKGATSFNQDISSWDVSKVTYFYALFDGATSFNQDISSWDVSISEEFENFLTGTAFSQENYDLLLQAWSLLDLYDGITFDADAQYSCSTSAARQSIIDNNNWTINDGGSAVACGVSLAFLVSGSDTSLYRPSDGDGQVPSSLADSYNGGSGTLIEVESTVDDFSFDSLTVAYDVVLSANYPDSANSVRLVFMYDPAGLELNSAVGSQSVKGIVPGTFFEEQTNGTESVGPLYATQMLPDSVENGTTYKRVEIQASTINGNAQFYDASAETPNSAALATLHFKVKQAATSKLKLDESDYEIVPVANNGDYKESLTLSAADSALVEFYPGDTSSPGVAGVPDGKVDFSDLTGFASAYFTTTDSASYRLKYDIGSSTVTNYYTLPQSDGVISFRDLVAFATGYTLSSNRNSSSDPEPTSDEAPELEPLALWLGEARSAGNGVFEVPVLLDGTVSAVSAMQVQVEGLPENATILGVERAELFAGENGFAAHRLLDSTTTDGAESTTAIIEIDAATLGAGALPLQTSGVALTILIESNEYPLLSARDAELVDAHGQTLPFEITNGPIDGDGTDGNGIDGAAGELPQAFDLSQNYPNPFNPSTFIRYALPEASDVQLEVYNITGQRIATLVNASQAAGTYEVSFDASNLSSGVYLYRLTAGAFTQTRQMMLVK